MEKLFTISEEVKSDLIVIDNFYRSPNALRDFALNVTNMIPEGQHSIGGYKGLRSPDCYRYDFIKEKIQSALHEPICDRSWSTHAYNGCFQVTSAENPQVYHGDENNWAGVLYLTPDAPIQSGTRTHRSKVNGVRDTLNLSASETTETFPTGFLDSTKFDTVDSLGNIFNRLVLFRSTYIHSAGPYFGRNMWDGRLVQLFFFNTKG